MNGWTPGHADPAFPRLHARPVDVYDSAQVWGRPDRGIQLFGTPRRCMRGRFPGFAPDAVGGYRLYRCQVGRMKLFDEAVFGAAVCGGGPISGDVRTLPAQPPIGARRADRYSWTASTTVVASSGVLSSR
jgi:hypothetical protein